MEKVKAVGYGRSGMLLDVHRPLGRPTGTVLLWHGRGKQERDVLAPLAARAAEQGLLVLVPDWRCDAPDSGWSQLHESVDFLRAHAEDWGGDADRAVLAGWSLGARAALATVLRPAREGWRPAAVVGIAGNYLTSSDPRMGPAAAADIATTEQSPVPLWLHHGAQDAVVDVRSAREFTPVARAHGWPVRYQESPTDHAGVVLAEYDRELRRCRPASGEHAFRAGELTAVMLTEAAASAS
ncbi:alpha/beta fold hydrolase [Streptacidiphilus sp. P02-A3a]|nr:alpha/beta fold hydrolase [Streptacidiphilus sp. P02-A3a]